MKKSIYIVITVLLSGCVTVQQNGSQLYRAYSSFDKAKKIEYKEEAIGDYWQTPTETSQYNEGDCEDKALYLQRMLIDNGIKAIVVFGELNKGDRTLHVWNEAKIDNELYILDVTSDVFEKFIDVKEKYPTSYIRPQLSVFEEQRFEINKDFLKRRLYDGGEKTDLVKYIRR